MPTLFDSITIKNLALKNRVVMPPMCTYSVNTKDGKATDWHHVHYVSRAVGGTGLIITEVIGIEPDGRITDFDLGLWSDEHIEPLKKMVDSCHAYGAKVAFQIGHAGRKAENAPIPLAPSAIPFSERYKTPRALSTEEVQEMVTKFEEAFKRAVATGVDSIEIHGAHGYLLHQFHSPLTNQRQDIYGEDKLRFGIEVIKAARKVIPESMPLIMRISAIEYVENGYGIDYALEVSKRYQEAGVDVFHVSSGGEGPIGSAGRPGSGPAYQAEFARDLKKALNCPVIAVGRLEDPQVANRVIKEEMADLAAVGRGMLRSPYWASEASFALGQEPLTPKAYERAYTI